MILASLNQLEDRNGAPDLVWLPTNIPAGVRLIVSTLGGRPLEELRKRGWPELTVEPLQPDECRQLIGDYLAQSARTLNRGQIDTIVAAPHTHNPLYLRTLLDELRVFGVHEKLNERIAYYLKAETISGLYERVLARWEEDYGSERNLVREAMSLLWAARRGLSETELLESLGAAGRPMARAEWSPLYLAAGDSLLSRSGMLTFAHHYIRNAVEHAYLPTAQDQVAAHLRVADYFEKREPSRRRTDELPWQLLEGQAWQRAYDLLADLSFLSEVWEANPHNAPGYWSLIERSSQLRVCDAYAATLRSPLTLPRAEINRPAFLLADVGHPTEAFSLRQTLVDELKEDVATSGGVGQFNVTEAFKEAFARVDRGELEAATEGLADLIVGALMDRKTLAQGLNNQAVLLRERGDLDGAMKIHKQQEEIFGILSDKAGLAMSYCNEAAVLLARGELDAAATLNARAESVFRELDNKAGVGTCLGIRAKICSSRGDDDAALSLLKESEQIWRELGNQTNLCQCLCSQGTLLQRKGDLDAAFALQKTAEGICCETGDKHGAGACLAAQASILYNRGNLDEAMTLLKYSEEMFREIGDKCALGGVLVGQSTIASDWGNPVSASSLLSQAEQIYREHENMDGLATCLAKRARMLYDQGDLEGALRLLTEEEAVRRKLCDKHGLAACLGNQGNILKDHDDIDRAMDLWKQQEILCRELGQASGLIAALAMQAQMLAHKRSQPQQALPLAEEAYRRAAANGFAVLAQQARGVLNGIRAKLK